MFINWSTDPTIGEIEKESIPPEQFKVKGWGVYEDTIITALAGSVVAAIGILLMIGEPCGSTMFWVGCGEALFGITTLMIAKMIHRSEEKKHQYRFLHRTQSLEEYKALLQSDRNVEYQFRDVGYLSKRKAADKANLSETTKTDLDRTLWKVNGRSVSYQDISIKKWPSISKEFPDAFLYANQSIASSLRVLIDSRYQQGKGSEATIVARSKYKPGENGKATCFNLITDPLRGNQVAVLECEAHFRLYSLEKEEVINYIAGKVTVDFATGDAVCTWSSPQDECPSFD